MKNKSAVLSILILILSFLALAGCEEDVLAPEGVDRPFSAYGVLNARRDTQAIAVSPIAPLLFDYPTDIDASVVSTDLTSGQRVSWKDSVVIGRRGQRDHIFWAPFRAQFGADYSVEIMTSNGETSSTTVHVPRRVDVSLVDRDSKALLFRIGGDSIRVLDASVSYQVRPYSDGDGGDVADSLFCDPRRKRTYSVDHSNDVYGSGSDWSVLIDIGRDHDELRDRLSGDGLLSWVPGRNGVALMEMFLELTIGNSLWIVPFDDLEDYALLQPEEYTAIENGYGTIVGGYNEETRVIPTTGTVDETPFFDFIQRPPTDCLDYCECGRGKRYGQTLGG